uniref:Uncharacterized protein n=1 Tax=Aegilops tauschii subsp. strangulata TaxID=200361 RepID=A0A453SJF0_AEGTS
MTTGSWYFPFLESLVVPFSEQGLLLLFANNCKKRFGNNDENSHAFMSYGEVYNTFWVIELKEVNKMRLPVLCHQG